MAELDRIENEIRIGEDAPDDAVLVVRGGPLAAEKLLEHARRQQRLYSFHGEPMASVSVSATIAGWTLDGLLAGPLATRSTYAICQVAALRASNYEILPTGPLPHYDILLPQASLAACQRLLVHFSDGENNPYKRRR